MKERTVLILKALVEDFIETANPVASQKLLASNQFKVSSATVRNEFSMLEEVGLIVSPHVSAGKVPTAKGYRFFVDEILPDLEAQNFSAVGQVFDTHRQQYRLAKSKESIFDALRLLAQLSGNVAFASVENDQTFYLGLSNVLRSPEFISDPEKAAQVVEILEGRERFKGFLDTTEIAPGEVKIFIGEENILEEISSCTLLVTKFKSANAQGAFGILGPMRMKYGYNKALIQNIAEIIV